MRDNVGMLSGLELNETFRRSLVQVLEESVSSGPELSTPDGPF